MADDAHQDADVVAVTRLLNEAGAGNAQAASELLPLVYEQLRALAARKMRQERPDQTLQATALVHEAYLRLVDHASAPKWDGRWHFFGAAAEAMRRILVDTARRRGRLKRGGGGGGGAGGAGGAGGGGGQRMSLDAMELTVDAPPDDLLALNDALEAFAAEHPREAELVKLRYFAGLTMEEAAEALGISIRSAGRAWSYARAWLFERMNA